MSQKSLRAIKICFATLSVFAIASAAEAGDSEIAALCQQLVQRHGAFVEGNSEVQKIMFCKYQAQIGSGERGPYLLLLSGFNPIHCSYQTVQNNWQLGQCDIASAQPKPRIGVSN